METVTPMDELDLLEHARTSIWVAEKALRLTLAPGIGWSVVDDLVAAQTAVTEQIEDLKRARGQPERMDNCQPQR